MHSSVHGALSGAFPQNNLGMSEPEGVRSPIAPNGALGQDECMATKPALTIVKADRPQFTAVDRLHKARTHGGYANHTELGEAAGIGRNKIGRLFAGSDKLTAKYAVLIGVACGVDPSWLMEGDDEETPPDGGVSKEVCAPWDLNPEPAGYGRNRILKAVAA